MVSGCLSFRQIRTRKSYKARKHGTFSTTQIPKLHYFRVLLGAFLHWRRYELLFLGCFACEYILVGKSRLLSRKLGYYQAKVYFHAKAAAFRDSTQQKGKKESDIVETGKKLSRQSFSRFFMPGTLTIPVGCQEIGNPAMPLPYLHTHTIVSIFPVRKRHKKFF